MSTFNNAAGSIVVDNLILVIQENKQYLSDIDGLIGDGDHGINMNKGFSLTRDELDKNPGDMVYSLMVLSRMLLMKIGGSMGPLYGKFFKGFAKVLEGKEEITQADVNEALKNIVIEIQSISPAKLGDKTLMDTLIPAVAAFDEATNSGQGFADALDALKAAAEAGRDSTKDMVAQLGRASRLGERSRGVLDAGSASCCLILCTMADSIKSILHN